MPHLMHIPIASFLFSFVYLLLLSLSLSFAVSWEAKELNLMMKEEGLCSKLYKFYISKHKHGVHQRSRQNGGGSMLDLVFFISQNVDIYLVLWQNIHSTECIYTLNELKFGRHFFPIECDEWTFCSCYRYFAIGDEISFIQ